MVDIIVFPHMWCFAIKCWSSFSSLPAADSNQSDQFINSGKNVVLSQANYAQS